MNLQTKEEQLFKRYLIRDVLQKNGYPRYAKALRDFYVNITNNPGIPSAAVDSTHGIIYINRNQSRGIFLLTDFFYSTVTDFARFLGLSTSNPFSFEI